MADKSSIYSIELNLFVKDVSVLVDMSGTSHFWSRTRREKVLGLGPGPFRNKFWCRS
jgi:hypothetical protein